MDGRVLKFEDLRVGDRWTSPGREISFGEIREFADLTGDRNPIHLDESYASSSPFGGRIAHGVYGLSLLVGLSSQSPNVETTALLDISDWKFQRPIYVGDCIHAVTEVIDLQDRGRRHGRVKWYRQLINQDGLVVQEGVLTTLVVRKNVVKRKTRSADLEAI